MDFTKYEAFKRCFTDLASFQASVIFKCLYMQTKQFDFSANTVSHC